MEWDRPGAAPYDPHTGEWYMFSQLADQGWKRLSRTVDLTWATSGELSFQISHDTELDWDYVIVEAHEVGTDNWTTLPDANGHTTQGTGESCAEGWVDLHPFVAHYQGADCSPTGDTGAWNAATGSSSGWQEWSVDLSAYAGKQVELSISYLTDWGTQGLGVFVDDTTVTVDGVATAETSFEDGLGGWTPAPAPEGSRVTNNWTRTPEGVRGGRRHHDRGHRVHGLRRGGPDDGGDAPRLRRPSHGPPPRLIALGRLRTAGPGIMPGPTASGMTATFWATALHNPGVTGAGWSLSSEVSALRQGGRP